MNQAPLAHLPSLLNIEFAQCTSAGRKPENQDSVGARFPEGAALACKGIALAIADGVSSSQAARQASQTAVTGFLSDYYATPETWRTEQSAHRVIQSLNRYLWSQSQNHVRQEGFLTTLSLLIFKGDKAFSFHVGDSRIYRYRQGCLEQLTRDHSQHLDADTTYLTRALGADLSLDVDIQSHEMECGDIYLLSTDGLHDVIDHRHLSDELKQNHNLEALCQTLCNTALALGSQDNISVQIARVEHLGASSEKDVISALSRLTFPPVLDIGQTLDGLTVEAILHESERSQVYRVRDRTGKSMVMKTPSLNYQEDAAFIERFARESWVGSRLNNRHLVRVLPPPRSRSCLYYLTEFIAGPRLSQLISERAPFAVADAIELSEQLVSAVRAMHRKDTLHQDLKPDNIVIGKQGACLIDFGSCWVAGIEEMASPIEEDKVLGTLDYSAPEYRYGGPVGPRSDQFSLALIMYEMLTGKHPYGPAYCKAMSLPQFQKLTYHSALTFNPLVPVWLDCALQKALQIHPAQRYEALSEWLQDLRRPNPNWLSAKHRPLLERQPETFWRYCALAGWTLALGLAIYGAGR